jgi:hypothetical protein
MSFNPNENYQEDASDADLRFGDAAFKESSKKHDPHLFIYCKFTFGFDMEVFEDVMNTSYIK